MKRFVTLLLVLVMLLGFLPQIPVSVRAEEVEESITRAEWIGNLVGAFGMFVEEDNYPDNYYSDITSEDEFYRDIMLAVEFGVIDLEAGLPFRPNDPATREFVAHTLNYSLGFKLDEQDDYTFSEAETVTYPDDIQVAINREWFALVDGAFLPNQAVTPAEQDIMLADVETVLAGDEIDKNYDSSASISEGTIEIPMGTAVSIPAENIVEITDCPVKIKANDVFVVYYGDLPLAYKALAVETEGNLTLISCTTEGAEDAIVSLDYEGTIEADLENFEGSDATTFTIGEQTVYMDRTTYGIGYDKDTKVLTATKTASLGDGISATISAKISNLMFELVSKEIQGKYRCVMSGDATLSTNVSVDLLEALGKAKTIELGRVYIGGVGYVKLSVEFSLSGEMSLVWTGDVKAGFAYDRGDGFRVIRSFNKKSFTFMAEVTLRSALRLDAGVDALVFDANVWAKVGAQMDVKATAYDAGSPRKCLDMDGFMFASVGVNGSIIKVINFGESYDIYTRSNSPIRAHYHYEDGKLVMGCTRGKASNGNGATSSDYYTDPGSNNFTPGTSNGSSSYTGSSGTPVVIYTYKLDENDNATITGYKGNASALYIPSTIDGYTVTAIGFGAFRGRISLYTVKIPNTVTYIDSAAFANCTNLAVVTLSNNLERMGAHAFYNCDSLTGITIPKSLEKTHDSYISEYAYGYVLGPFYGCDNLKDIVFEEGTTIVANGLFANCPGIETVVIPDSVTSVNNNAFQNCTNLKNVQLSSSTVSINDWAFKDCTSLKEIVMPNTVTHVGAASFGNCAALEKVTLSKKLITICAHAFYNCDALTSIEIPKSLEKTYDSYISEYAYGYVLGPFYGCDNLKDIVFEEGTTIVANGLFANCPGIETVVIPDSVTSVNNNAFQNCTNLKNVQLSSSTVSINDWAFKDCTSLKEIVMPNTVTHVGAASFGNCTALEKVTLSKNLITICAHAFYNCDALTSIEIPKSLEKTYDSYISEYAYGYVLGPFYECDNLKNVIFEEGMKYIPNALFANCPGLVNIEIPETITSIKKNAFQNCKNLTSISLPNSLATIEERAFEKCTSLKAIDIPDTVEDMGSYIFSNCSSLETVKVPNQLKKLVEGMFENCTSLKSVELPDTLTTILAKAFYNCDALISLGIPENVTEIKENAFYDCDVLISIAIPGKVTSVGTKAFYDCDALETVTMGNGVTTVGTSIFEHCDVLKNVKLSRNLTAIPASAFKQCAELAEITVPYYVTTIGNNAFNSNPKLVKVVMPRGLTSIGTTAFSYADRMVIYGVSGTYAETWAADNGFQFVANDVSATEVSLNKTELTLNKGSSDVLALTVTPEDATDQITWKSGNTSVATVTDKGVVKAVGTGSTTIKVTVGNLSASCKVTVVQPVTSISLNKTSLTLEALGTYQMTATANPSNAFDKTISWSTSSPEIATVDENGLVTALTKGTATITATANDGSGVSKSCTVTVSNNGYVMNGVEGFESSHPYDSNCRDFWIYTSKDAIGLFVTFDEKTMMEDGFDYLYIFDAEGKEIGKYTGAELAGKTIEVPGDTVKIQINSDDSGSDWGFKVTNVEAHAHEYETLVTDPTCTEKGYSTHTCSCGDSYVDTYVDALGHKMGEWEIIKEASCSVDGSKTRSCERTGCNETETEKIAAHGMHVFDQEKVDPKYLLSEGVYYKSCKCGEAGTETFTVNAEEPDECAHSWLDATCTTAKTCKVCGETEGAAQGHDWDAATCTEPKTCKTCGATDGSALGHNWTDATCTEPKTCTVCKATEGNANGHKWSEATCTEPKTCSVCKATEGNANGHKWSEATCTAPKTCSVCKATEGNAKGHSWADATCTEAKTCSVCKITEGEAKGHSWVDTTCTEPKTCKVCGVTDGDPIPHVFDQEKADSKYLVSEGVYYKSCKCGAAGTETFTVKEEKPEEKPVEFKDVPQNAYYHSPVMWAVENKVTSGTGDGTTFEPNAVCTRGQVVTFLWRAAGQPEPKNTDNPFKDVKTSDYFYKAVLWALENKITTGTGDGTTFEPHANCNRGQIVTFLSRAKNGKATNSDNPFVDVASNAYYYNPVLWAVEKGITTGTGDGTTFEPNANCTRGQVITFLYRAYNK